MATREIKSCDKCGTTDSVRSLCIDYDRYCDAAGDMDDKTLYIDLCPKCMAYIIIQAFKYRSDFTINNLKEWAHQYI